ncbi:MAG: organic solvent tolerance protein OstA [Flavobacteriales bacterium]|nr:organic solvent tolerance protein OstA [Flavobacteriales bacterium]
MKAINLKLYSFIGLFLLCSYVLSQQKPQEKPKKIKIKSSRIIEKNPKLFQGNIFLAGSVHLEHDKANIFADTILIDEAQNTIQARSNVKMKMQDGTILTCKEAEYNGNTKKAVAKGNVILVDKDKTITTETLYYDRVLNQAYFNTGGTIITSEQKLETQELIYDKNINQAYFSNWGTITNLKTGDVITSKSGRYFMNENRTEFDTSLTMNTKDYVIDSQKMTMNNRENRADFYGATTVRDASNYQNYVYTENGYYYTKRKEGFLKKNSRIHYDGKILKGDDMYYNDNSGYGKAVGNVILEDPKEKRILKGGFGEIFKQKDSAIITGRPYGTKAFEKDSLYFSADTLVAMKKKENGEENSIVRGYNKVRIFKTDLQGKSDSLVYNESNGKLEFYKNPIFWSGNHQISSDTVYAYMNSKTEKIDSIQFFQNAFAVSKVDSLNAKEYNQTKGKSITGYLENDEIKNIFVRNNAQSISYIDDEDKKTKAKSRIGINRSNCGIIIAEFKDRDLDILSCKINGESKLYPEEKILENDRFLPGFVWREKERLKRWQDILVYTDNNSE